MVTNLDAKILFFIVTNIQDKQYNESKYGNKIGSELKTNLSADQSDIFYKV